jgi:hypothetical protein
LGIVIFFPESIFGWQEQSEDPLVGLVGICIYLEPDRLTGRLKDAEIVLPEWIIGIIEVFVGHDVGKQRGNSIIAKSHNTRSGKEGIVGSRPKVAGAPDLIIADFEIIFS